VLRLNLYPSVTNLPPRGWVRGAPYVGQINLTQGAASSHSQGVPRRKHSPAPRIGAKQSRAMGFSTIATYCDHVASGHHATPDSFH
jgi:hypothetical protein